MGIRKLLLILAVVGCLAPDILLAAETYDRKTERVWTTVDGQKTTARFSGLIRNEVLLNAAGSSKRIAIENLSPEDIDWLREMMTIEGTPTKLPLEYRSKPGSAPNATAPVTTPQAPQAVEPITKPEATPAPATPAVTVPAETPPPSTSEQPAEETPLEAVESGKPVSSPNAPAVNGPSEQPPAGGLSATRTWTMLGGKKLEAHFHSISSEGKEVTLQGATFETMALSLLAREDLVWLQNAMREEGRLNEMAMPYRDPPDSKLRGADLTKFRKTKYFRKWTLKSGVTDNAQWERLDKGEVHLIRYENKMAVNIPYRDLSDSDQEYVRGRLKREYPGELFPYGAPTVLSPEQIASGYRVWTDFDGKRVAGKLVRSEKAQTVNILETAEGEKAYIAAFFAEEDRATIDGINNPPPVAVASTGGNMGNSNSTSPFSRHDPFARARQMEQESRQRMERSMQGLEKRRQESEHRMAEMQRHSDEFSQMNIESMKKAQAQTEAWRQQSEQSRASVAQATQSPTLPSNLSQPQSLEYYWYCTSCKKEISGLNDICSCVWRRLFKIVGGLIMVVGSVIGFCAKAKRS